MDRFYIIGRQQAGYRCIQSIALPMSFTANNRYAVRMAGSACCFCVFRCLEMDGQPEVTMLISTLRRP